MSFHRFQDLFALACSPVGCPPLPWSFHCQPLLRAASDRCRSSPSRCSRSRGMFCCPGDPLDGSRSALELRIPFRQHTFGPFPTYATFDVFFSMHSRCSSLFCQVPLLSSLSLLSLLHSTHQIIMQNEEGNNVDLYIPRKCSYTNRLVEAKDHASVQINVANVDPVTGIMTGESTPYCLAGYIRFKSESDMALTTLVQKRDAQLFGGGGASATE